jgi:hypothetical protein
MAPASFAQAPTPTFRINGLIDQVGTYTRNMSGTEIPPNLARNTDTALYGRTRGRLDFIGEYGKTKAVLGIEIDSWWGQMGAADTVAVGGASSSFDLNTDTLPSIETKWVYTEFEVPLIPWPTVGRLGAQPFDNAATYKVGAYATGDFAGVKIVSAITPNLKLLFTYVAVEEAGTGKRDFGSQTRGDDFAIIASAEITPLRGLDLKPMYSYFYANGVTGQPARTVRGGHSIVNGGAFAPNTVSGADGVGTGVHENRHTIGVDARWRSGPFSLDPTVLYQFGTRDAYNTTTPAYGILCNSTGNPATNCTKQTADISAWLIDIRAGYEIGPWLVQGLYMWTPGNRARDTLLKKINFFQPLDTDSSYLADWGTQITSIGVDYYQQLTTIFANPGVSIGYNKYGRQQVGVKASYALTPELSLGAGWTILWTDKAVDTDSIAPGGPNTGALPSFVDRKTGKSGRPEGESKLLGTELNAGLTWRVAPGLDFDFAVGYLFAGAALGARHTREAYCEAGKVNSASCQPPDQKDRRANDVIITTARVRFTF